MTGVAAEGAVAVRKWRLPSGPAVQHGVFGVWTVLVFLFLYAPILLLVVYSFNDARMGVQWEGFTLKWYEALFSNAGMINAFKNSLIVASATTLLSTVLGTLGAWMMFRYKFPLKNSLGILIFIPMVMPEVLMGVSLLILFVFFQMNLGYLTLIIAHTTFCFPFVLVGVQARLQGIDPFLEEAAMDLGASPIQAFFKVILPYLTPAVIAGALMAFTLSFDEYIVTLFTTGAQSQTLPIRVYGMARRGLSPELNALSGIFVLVTMLIVLSTQLIRKRN